MPGCPSAAAPAASFKSPRVYQRPERISSGPSGGRTWWAHFEFTRINIALTILQKDIEELMNVRGIGEKSFLKLKPLIVVTAKPTADRPA